MSHLRLVRRGEGTAQSVDRIQGHNSSQESGNVNSPAKNQSHHIRTLDGQLVSRMSYIKQLHHIVNLFRKLRWANPEKDYSRYFLVFAYNFYSLGLKNFARKMLDETSINYFEGVFYEDFVRCSDQYKRFKSVKRQMDISGQEIDQDLSFDAEFYIAACKILPFLTNHLSVIKEDHFEKTLLDESEELNEAPDPCEHTKG